jgi:uncharacterized repeat protein (TIGR04076 family)
MPAVKITVLKRLVNRDLVDELCEEGVTVPCPMFTEGQEFVVESNRQPEGFCSAAWHDIHKSFLTIARWGHFADGWMKDDDTIIACCADGLRPVVFEIKRIGE